MPIDDHDTKWVIPMYKADGDPVVVYSHNKKQWKEYNDRGYSDQPLRVKMEYPKTMRSYGQPSTQATDPAHEERLRAQGYTTEVLPKGHNDPAAVIHDPARVNRTPSRVDALEEQNKALQEQLMKQGALLKQLLEDREAKGKRGKKQKDDEAA